MTNIIKCMLPKNRKPKSDEIASCSPYLDKEIDLIDPKILASLGYYAMASGKFIIVIMDEVCVAIFFELLKTQDLLSLMEEKPGSVELILTGRYCPPELIERADLVTEMQEIKHYYQKGVAARKGIES